MGISGPSKIERDFEELGEEIPEQYIGLENKGYICYANSILQCLYFCKEFRRHLLDQPITDPDSLLGTLKDLFLTISSSKKKSGVVDSKKFMQRLRSLFSIFDNEEHHDSHEFLISLISHLDDELKKNSQESWVQTLFEGKTASETKCTGCGTVTTREEEFRDLSLDVEPNSSLLHSLKQFSSTELLSGADKFDCDNCGCKQEAEKRTLIKQPPEVLICHLKRFKYNEITRRHVKLLYRIPFPKELRLLNTVEGCPDRLYELFAMIVHLGPGFHYGHYFAIVKSHRYWIRFDDAYVERVDESAIQSIFGTAKEEHSPPCGYILFYRARS